MATTYYRAFVCSASPSPDGVSEMKNGSLSIRCKLPTDAPTGAFTGYPITVNLPADASTSTSCALPDGSTNNWCELGNLSIENAQVIGGYMGIVFAVAWGFRVLRKSIITSKESE